jgi:hypothetical protein
VVLGSNKPLTEMSTRTTPEGKSPAGKADNLAAICEPDYPENAEASTSHKPMGLDVLLQG